MMKFNDFVYFQFNNEFKLKFNLLNSLTRVIDHDAEENGPVKKRHTFTMIGSSFVRLQLKIMLSK